MNRYDQYVPINWDIPVYKPNYEALLNVGAAYDKYYDTVKQDRDNKIAAADKALASVKYLPFEELGDPGKAREVMQQMEAEKLKIADIYGKDYKEGEKALRGFQDSLVKSATTGDIKMLQGRYDAYKEYEKYVKETYKDNPDVAAAYLNNPYLRDQWLKKYDPNNLNIQSPNLAKYYDSKEMQEMLDKALTDVKPDATTMISLIDPRHPNYNKIMGELKAQDFRSMKNPYEYLISKVGKEYINFDKLNEATLGFITPEIQKSLELSGIIHYGKPGLGSSIIQNYVIDKNTGETVLDEQGNPVVLTEENKGNYLDGNYGISQQLNPNNPIAQNFRHTMNSRVYSKTTSDLTPHDNGLKFQLDLQEKEKDRRQKQAQWEAEHPTPPVIVTEAGVIQEVPIYSQKASDGKSYVVTADSLQKGINDSNAKINSLYEQHKQAKESGDLIRMKQLNEQIQAEGKKRDAGKYQLEIFGQTKEGSEYIKAAENVNIFGNTLINVKNNETGQIIKVPMRDLHQYEIGYSTDKFGNPVPKYSVKDDNKFVENNKKLYKKSLETLETGKKRLDEWLKNSGAETTKMSAQNFPVGYENMSGAELKSYNSQIVGQANAHKENLTLVDAQTGEVFIDGANKLANNYISEHNKIDGNIKLKSLIGFEFLDEGVGHGNSLSDFYGNGKGVSASFMKAKFTFENEEGKPVEVIRNIVVPTESQEGAAQLNNPYSTRSTEVNDSNQAKFKLKQMAKAVASRDFIAGVEITSLRDKKGVTEFTFKAPDGSVHKESDYDKATKYVNYLIKESRGGVVK